MTTVPAEDPQHADTTAARTEMIPYDAKAWASVERWRERRLEREARGLLPGAWRERANRASRAAREKLEALPGSERFEKLFLDALRGLTDLGARAARASVHREAVLRAYRKQGYAVDTLGDIRQVSLRDIDKVMPRLDLAYIVSSTLEGAVAGLVVSGGQLLAAGGVLGAGAGAAPGAGAVVGAMAADAAAVLFASHRVVAHIAAYYGYDVEDPQEQLFALGVLGVGTAAGAGKAAAYVELNKLVQGLARRQAWKQLNRNAVTRTVSRVYATLGMRLTQRKLAQAVPVAGIVIGAGLNARLLANIADDAHHLYRERFLREKYGLEQDLDSRAVGSPDAVKVADILDAEIVDEHER